MTAAAERASRGKAKAHHDMSNLPSRKKFSGHTQEARTRAIDSEASVVSRFGRNGASGHERKASVDIPGFAVRARLKDGR